MSEFTKKRYRLRIVIPAYAAFNIYSYVANRTTALGPVCVASAANEIEGWDVEVIDENNLRMFGPKSERGGADHEFLQKERPADVVGFYGGLTSTIPRLYEVAKFYKDKGIMTIAGGQHFVSENIKEALHSGIDYVVIGEGEQTIKELIQAFQKKQEIENIKGIAYLEKEKIIYTSYREPQTDFDKLPLPDFSLVRYARIKIYPVERIRGCGMDCEFCTVKGKPRHASPARLLEHISSLVETKDASRFFIVDDLFGQRLDETIKFCNMLTEYQKKIGKRLDITAQIRWDKAKNSELLSAMRKAAINTVAIGFESPIEEELTAMKKQVRTAEMISSTKKFRKFGFFVHGMFIFGYPLHEGINFTMPIKEQIKHFKRFIRKAKIDTVQVLLPVPFAGTKLRERLEKQGRIYPKEDVGWEYYDGNFPLFNPDPPGSAEEIQTATRKIMRKFYQFKYMFLIGLNIFSFPSIIFYFHNIKAGWGSWYRRWHNNIVRFIGWITMKKWLSEFKKDKFTQKLQNAKKRLAKTASNLRVTKKLNQ